MTPKDKPKSPDEDEAQSQRFLDLSRRLEAGGDLKLAEDEAAFERIAGKAAPQKAPRIDENGIRILLTNRNLLSG